MSEASKNNGSLAQPKYSDKILRQCLQNIYDNGSTSEREPGRLFCPHLLCRVVCKVNNDAFLDGPLSSGRTDNSANYSKSESSRSSIYIHSFKIGNPNEVKIKPIIEDDSAVPDRYLGLDFITVPVDTLISVLNEDGRSDLYSACEKLLVRKAAKLSESITSTSSNVLENTNLQEPTL